MSYVALGLIADGKRGPGPQAEGEDLWIEFCDLAKLRAAIETTIHSI